MRRLALFAALLALAGCGIDGPPAPPPGSLSDDGVAGVGVVGEA